MTPAARHLLTALHDPAGRDEALLAGLSEPEWADVAALAIRQRVGPLLYSRQGLGMPPDVRATLRTRAHRSTFRMLSQHAAFRELIDAVTPLGIEVVALKGLHLSTSVYASAGLREMADLDLLVLSEHVKTVKEVAQHLGYVSLEEAGDAHQHLPPLRRKGITLELHWQLLSPTAIRPPDTAALFARSQPLEGAPGGAGLTAEDLLVHICAHAAGSHLLTIGLQPLCDLQAIVQKHSTIDWATVDARGQEWRCQRSVSLMLMLARTHLGVPIPQHACTSNPENLPSAELLETAFSTVLSGAGELALKSPTAAHLLRLDGPLNKARYVVDQLFRPSAEQAAASPDLRMTWWARSGHVMRRASGVVRRHGGWLWRASRERDGALRQSLDRRNALADWIRER